MPIHLIPEAAAGGLIMQVIPVDSSMHCMKSYIFDPIWLLLSYLLLKIVRNVFSVKD